MFVGWESFTLFIMHVNLSFFSMQFYQRGIFDEPNCSVSKVTHAMLAVGYGRSNGKDYWLLKNRFECMCIIHVQYIIY